jgi:hypothetical protein
LTRRQGRADQRASSWQKVLLPAVGHGPRGGRGPEAGRCARLAGCAAHGCTAEAGGDWSQEAAAAPTRPWHAHQQQQHRPYGLPVCCCCCRCCCRCCCCAASCCCGARGRGFRPPCCSSCPCGSLPLQQLNGAVLAGGQQSYAVARLQLAAAAWLHQQVLAIRCAAQHLAGVARSQVPQQHLRRGPRQPGLLGQRGGEGRAWLLGDGAAAGRTAMWRRLP